MVTKPHNVNCNNDDNKPKLSLPDCVPEAGSLAERRVLGEASAPVPSLKGASCFMLDFASQPSEINWLNYLSDLQETSYESMTFNILFVK